MSAEQETGMEVSEELLEGGIIKINLSGRMDTAGVTQHADIRFAGMCAAPRTAIAVDLSDVSFLASVGIRSLVSNAQAVVRRGGKFVLLNPAPNVTRVLEMAGLLELLPICRDLQAVRGIFTGSL